MGVDLTLMPVLSPDRWISNDLIGVERRRELWPEIAKLERGRTTTAVTCFVSRRRDGELGYGEMSEDPYGGHPTWVTAGDLSKLKNHEAVQDSWRNKGIWKMLAEYPKDWPIILYWH